MIKLIDAKDLLENYTFVEVLLCVISGKTYSSAIAKALKKSQPTVTEQLKKLESAQLIKALIRKKAQEYEVNWDLMFEIFYDKVYDAITYREDYLDEDIKKITRASLEGIVPRNLFKGFLKEYYHTLHDVGGIKKDFDGIISSFFLALEELDKKMWKKLLTQYAIDGDNLALVANVLACENYVVEQTALQGLLEFGENTDTRMRGR